MISKRKAVAMFLIASMLLSLSSEPLVAAHRTASSPANDEVRKSVVLNGTVVDAKGVPVVGATVMVKGAPSLGGQITDIDGRFTFKVPQSSIVEISCIGFQTYEFSADSDASPKITLAEDSQLLEEVVVVGYGTQRKESVVGAISQVETDAIVNSGTTNVTNAIAGKLSGVQTYQLSGQPGSSNATIVIRGVSSWNGSSPLVMVDGIERDFSTIDPNEIQSVSVLKDASATAVYGAKGANGVILVTTRTGNEGKAKMNLSVDYGMSTPTCLPNHISSYDTGRLANVAMKNSGNYGELLSDAILSEYRNPSSKINSVRYPDTDFYDLMLNNFIQEVNANFNLSGGSKIVKYFVSAGYTHESSLVKQLYNWKNTDYGYDRINYRTNLDITPNKSTKISVKAGGSTAIQQYPSTNGLSTSYLFTYLYKASPMMYPAYYPSWMLDMVPDPDHPDVGDRVATASSGIYKSSSPNPYQYFGVGDFSQRVTTKLFVDLIFNQKLDFITKGLSVNAKASLTSSFYKIAREGDSTRPTYRFNWDVYDRGTGNPWEPLSSNSTGEVYVVPPYAVTQDNTAKNQNFTYNIEASLNYDRSFKNHYVTGLLLYHQREYNLNASFPHRTQGFVARATYDYGHKYLLELNMGLTGSEQFAPKNRYGFFPSVAVGYFISKEKWWKNAMPWWNKMKIRYSDGLVGSDSASSNWLYYSSFTKSGSYIYEDKAANLEARWETAHKRDIGVEMAFLDDLIDVSVDLYDEKRKDMLIAPISTPLVAVESKEVNRGALKKHGIDIEIKIHKSYLNGFNFEVGTMIGLNENRVTSYEEAVNTPEWQKQQGKPFDPRNSSAGSYLNGMNPIDGGFYNTIDDIHGYPAVTSKWSSLFPGTYKILDYNNDGKFSTDDLHAIAGLSTPPMVYSFNLGLGYKGFSFNVLFYGNKGKKIPLGKAYAKEFGKGDYLIREGQLDYWTPTNRDARHSALSFNDDSIYAALGGSYNGYYTMMLDGYTWVNADYLQLKELYVGYSFDRKKIKKALHIEGLTINLTGNNLFMISNLPEGDPQFMDLAWNYYPVMASVKLGVKLTF